MDPAFILRHYPLYIKAAVLTVTAGGAGILLSVAVGLLCAVARYYKIPVFRAAAAVYTELSRNTPLIVQLFFLYFGLPKVGIVLSSEVCGIIGLSFLGGGYMSEAFLSGFKSIKREQVQSAQSLGFSVFQIFRYVIFPNAVTSSMPAISANIIFLLKETSVFSAVALADLMYVAKDLIGMYSNTVEALFMLVISYLVIILPISLICSFAERRLRRGGH